MEQVTIEQVRGVFARFAEACTRYGLVADGRVLRLAEGSKLYGNAFRVYETGTDRTVPGWSAHHSPTVGSDFLGMTKREAYDALVTRARCVEDMGRELEIRLRFDGVYCSECGELTIETTCRPCTRKRDALVKEG